MIELRMIEVEYDDNPLFAQRELIYACANPEPVCVEIGVFTGANSQHMLTKMQPKELHLVDPWQMIDNIPEYPLPVKSNERMAEIHASVVERFSLYRNVTINRGLSTDIARTFPDHYFDFIYIDGNHSYEDALEDLEAWFPKLKPTGIMAGDDFSTYSVTRAVTQFCETHGFCLYGTFSRDTTHSQFFIDHAKRYDFDNVTTFVVNDCHNDMEFIATQVAHLPGRPESQYKDFLKHLLQVNRNLTKENAEKNALIHLLEREISDVRYLYDRQGKTYTDLLRQHLIVTGVLSED